MEENKNLEILELIYRTQKAFSQYFKNQESIKVSIGKRTITGFPLSHIFLFPNNISESILQHIKFAEKVQFDFKNYNDLVYQYYKLNHFEDIYKFRDETIKVWHVFNKDKIWGYDEPISEVKACVERLEEKWKNGIDNFDQEIRFINDNFEQFAEKHEEEYIKNIPIEIYNKIVHQLPEKRKVEWITKILLDGKEDIKSNRVEIIGELDIDQLNTESFDQILEIIDDGKNEKKWIGKIHKHFLQQNQLISERQKQENIELKKNQEILKKLEEKEAIIKKENLKNEELIKNKKKLYEEFEKEKLEKEKLEKEKHDEELILNPGPDGCPFKVKFDSSTPLNGIFKHLYDKDQIKNMVNVQASSYPSQKENILDQNSETRWQSGETPNSWVSFQIKNHKIRADYYTIKTYKVNAGPSGYHMKSWVLEGSLDNQTWTTLDTRSGDFLNGAHKMVSFPIANPQDYSFYRLRMTSPNFCGNDAMTVSQFELFGIVL